nr:recombinase family protein [Auraticoccus cholistanensis]
MFNPCQRAPVTSPSRKAVIYCRISRDGDGQEVGVKRQEVDCRALAERSGIEVWRVAIDNDISASNLSKKVRPAYASMLRDVRPGLADTVIVYSNSRLTRRPAEWMELIQLADEGKPRIRTVVPGSHDLSTADGRALAITVAAWDAAEAERTSERLKRAHLGRAMEGKVWKGGNRAFGWSEDYKALHPTEAPHLKEAVEQVLGGVAITSIAKRWNAQGVLTPAGREWTYQALKVVLMNPRLCGWMTYKKEVMRDEQGKPIIGEWEPLMTEEQHEALLAAIEKRHTPKRRFGKYLLTHHLRCGKCSQPMFGVVVRGEQMYRCKGQHFSITASVLERYVKTATFVHLSECKGDLEAEPPAEWLGEGRLAEVNSKIQELMATYNAGRVSGDILLPQVEELDEERKQLTKERDEHYREQLVQKAPSLVDELPQNVDFSIGETEWLEDWDDQIQDAYDFDGWQAMLAQHCRVIFIKPYAGPHKSTTDRISIMWDDGTTHGAPADAQPMPCGPKLPKQLPEVIELLKQDPKLSGVAVAERYGVSRSYGFRLLKQARESLAMSDVS